MTDSFDTGLFLFWLATGLLMMAGAAIALVWAIRSGQFRDMDRARYLALWSGIPEDGEREEEKAEGNPSRKH